MTRKHISTPNLASLLLSGLLPLIFLNETFNFLLWDFFRNLGTFVFKSNTAINAKLVKIYLSFRPFSLIMSLREDKLAAEFGVSLGSRGI